MGKENRHKEHENLKKSQAAFETPKMIGSYFIENLLDTGGMSYVYLAQDPETKEPVTIKVLSPKYISHPEVVQRFLNEANIIALTDHPNIVKLYGHGEWEGGLYIAMEFIQGVSLRQYFKYHSLSLEHALEIILQIAYAICHLHTHGVIHRDLKLENVLMTDDGIVKVIDFGIAQLLDENRVKSNSRQFIGTPVYMSPEQRENPTLVSYPSDIYSLGIIAYELILGRVCHGRVHISLMPKGLQKIIAKCLQPLPEDRYHDIVDFITDVSSYLNSLNFQKDKNEADFLRELSENLEQAQTMLVSQIPKWNDVEVGMSYQRALSFIGISVDYFLLTPDQYSIVVLRPMINSAESFITLAILKGLIRSLIPHCQPAQLVSKINEYLIMEKNNLLFSLHYVLFSSLEKNVISLSCGHEDLWLLPKDPLSEPLLISGENGPVGEQLDRHFIEKKVNWNSDDSLILSSLIFPKEGTSPFKEKIKETLKEYASFPVQKQAEAILRKIKAISPKPSAENTLAIIVLRHSA